VSPRVYQRWIDTDGIWRDAPEKPKEEIVKAPILTDEQAKTILGRAVSKDYSTWGDAMTAIAQAQRDADHEHYMKAMWDLFNKMQRNCPHCKSRYKQYCQELKTEVFYRQPKDEFRFLEGE